MALDVLEEQDTARLRGLLAERQISRREFAEACGLNRLHVGMILNGRRRAGELSRIKLHRGLIALGLDKETQHAAR